MTTEWFLQSIAIAMLVILPGGVWSRGFRGPWLARFAAASAAGLGLILPIGILLAELGLFRGWVIAGAACLLIGSGSLVNPPGKPSTHLLELPGFTLVLSFLLLIIRLCPVPGEWIAGGWDPGVLINEAVWIARSNSLNPADPAFAELIRDPLLSLFAKTQGTLQEAYPGLPFDADAGQWAFYFYPATPILGAMVSSLGDIDWLLRLPIITGLLSLLIIAGCVADLSGKNLAGIAVGLTLATLPVWLFHARTPNSEMLELALLAGLVCWGFGKSPRQTRGPILFALMLTLVLNRISAILFGSLFLVFLAADVRHRPPRFWSWMASGLLAGWMYYLFLSPESLVKLTHILPRILSASSVMVISAGFLLAADRLPRQGHRVLPWLVFLAGIAGWLVLENTGHQPWQEWSANVHALIDYLHPAFALAALAGACMLSLLVPSARSPILFLSLCLLIVLHQKHVAELYPWALKRFFPFAAPLVAVSILAIPALSEKWKWPRWIPALAVVSLIGSGLYLQRSALREIVTQREFIGLNEHLAALAADVPTNAIVIADHFRWATPLAAIRGLTVLNGEALWSKRDSALTEQVIQRLNATGRPLVWITGTSQGLAVYPRTHTWTATQQTSLSPLPFKETIHHPRNRGFSAREQTLYGTIWKTEAVQEN